VKVVVEAVIKPISIGERLDSSSIRREHVAIVRGTHGPMGDTTLVCGGDGVFLDRLTALECPNLDPNPP